MERPRAQRARLLCRTAALVGLATLGAPASAAAEAPPIERRSAAGLDTYFWPSSGVTFVLAPFFHYELRRGLFADVTLAFAPETVSNQTSRFGLGNPTLGVHYAASDARNVLTRFLGVRFGVPLATAGSADSDVAGQAGAIATSYYDPYRFTVEHVPFIGLFGLELHPIPALMLRLPVEPMLFVPMAKEYALRGGVQARLEIEGRAPNGVGGGFALQGVVGNLFPQGFKNDRAQFAAEPYFAFDNGTVIARAGLLFSVDDPLGPLNVTSAHLQLGGHLR